MLLYGCIEQPEIPVPNTLEIALGNKYASYVSNLNKACERDTSALLVLLKMDDIYDAAGYDHGYMLVQLMKLNGDTSFAKILQCMTRKDLNNVSQYIEVGLDANDSEKYEMKNKFPLSMNILYLK